MPREDHSNSESLGSDGDRYSLPGLFCVWVLVLLYQGPGVWVLEYLPRPKHVFF